MTIPSSGIIT